MRLPANLGFFVLTALWCGCADSAPPAPATPAPRLKKEPAKAVSDPWFVDEAKARGITLLNRTGQPGKKEFIMSAVGPGAAVFDADGDGKADIYIVNGNRLLGPQRDRLDDSASRPRNALYIQQEDGTFVNEAKARGVDHDGWGFGACAADLDNDGDSDLIVSNLGANCLFLNDGTGHFTDAAEAAGLAGGRDDWSTGIACADYDRDGLLDIYIANYADLFSWLRKNPGILRGPDGEIIDAATCDWQGLKVYCGPRGLPGQQDRLYRNLGGARFEDVTKATGVWRSKETTGPLYGFQILFADLTRDGWPDIYVANDSVPSFFFESIEGKRFEERAQRLNIALGDMGEDMAGMGVDCADINADGWLDIFKTNFAAQTNNVYLAEPYRDQTGKERLSYRDVSAQTGIKHEVYADLGWAVHLFDYDNDGDRDLFFANGHVYPEVDEPVAAKLKMNFEQVNRMFRNESEKSRLRFVPVTAEMGPGFAIQRCSRGASLLDFDNDGDLDLIVVNLNAAPNLLVNKRGSASGHWLQIRLVGNVAKGSNRDAVGSAVSVTAGDLRQFFLTKRGRGFLGCSDPRIHVGLGARTGPVEVAITWPNGDKTKATVARVDRVVELRQP